MPMLDAYIPAGALTEDAENRLLAALTDILIRGEGADPDNAETRALAWVSVFRPEKVFVAGAPADAPRYRMVAGVPEGQWTDSRREKIVAKITAAVLDAEEGRQPRDADRVWVLTPEVPEGSWGGGGKIVRLADIVEMAIGDRDAAESYAAKVLANRRSTSAGVSMTGSTDSVPDHLVERPV